MHPLLSSIKAVGFDLDRTLYPQTLEMNERVTQEVVTEILKVKPALRTLKKVRKVYEKRCAQLLSWPKVLKEIGLANPQETMNRCLERADITSLIKADAKLVNIMKRLSQKFFLFMITGSTRHLAGKKLAKIGLTPELFNFSLCGDDPPSIASSPSKNFVYFLAQTQSPYAPSEHVFIGDNLQTDIIIPKMLGMKTIFVGKPTPEADFSITDIHEIENLLLP